MTRGRGWDKRGNAEYNVERRTRSCRWLSQLRSLVSFCRVISTMHRLAQQLPYKIYASLKMTYLDEVGNPDAPRSRNNFYFRFLESVRISTNIHLGVGSFAVAKGTRRGSTLHVKIIFSKHLLGGVRSRRARKKRQLWSLTRNGPHSRSWHLLSKKLLPAVVWRVFARTVLIVSIDLSGYRFTKFFATHFRYSLTYTSALCWNWHSQSL